MIARRMLCAGIALAVVMAGGCVSRKNPPTSASERVAPAAGQDQRRPSTQPDTMDASVGTADALAHKTASYSKTLESLMAQRSTAASAGADVSPSDVQWLDPNDLRLSPVPADNEPQGKLIPVDPAVVPVIDAAPGEANQIASVSGARKVKIDSNMPAIVPEGHDALETPPTAGLIQTDAMAKKFAQRVKDNPRDVAAHLDHQLLRFLNEEPVPDLAALSSLPTEEREFLAAVLDGLSNFRSAVHADHNMLLSRKIEPILQTSDRLRAQADLIIPTVALCRKVDGFGVYDPIDPARFIAGHEHPAIVYCEVANFASHLNDKKLWETKLTQEVVLYTDTEAGLPVWQDKTKTITDLSRNRRHDFFVVKMIKLPRELTVGRYVLKISIVDQQASRIAEATLPLVIVAQ